MPVRTSALTTPMKKTALVTGAEGFIGSHMVNFLHNKGWNVIGSYLRDGSAAFPRKPSLHFEQCDLRNGQRVTQILAHFQPTHIFHLGAQSLPTVSWADPVMTFESNVMGSLHLFEGVRHMKRRPVVVSACSSARSMDGCLLQPFLSKRIVLCGRFILTESARFVLTCWHVNIFLIIRFPRLTSGFLILRGRAAIRN